MTLVCKKCGKQDIENEAFNARTGGFFCRSCYRRVQAKSIVFGCLFAIVVTTAVFAFIIYMVVVAK